MCNDQQKDCSIKLDKLSACKIKSKCITSNDLCSQRVEAKKLEVESEVANSVCAQKVQAKESWSDKSYTNSLCARTASIDQLCVNKLQVNDFDACNVYRAAVTMNADSTYTLGSAINWNIVLDDPSSDVSLNPFSYTVEAGQSGYYSLDFQMNHHGLSGASVIAGLPIGVLTILVNGLEFRTQYAPFLSFSDSQKANIAALVLLNVGDVVTMKYDVLVLDPNLGLTPYSGTVVLEANGLFPGKSGFTIIQLSTLCNGSGQPITCAPCPIVQIECSPVSTPCDPVDEGCHDRQRDSDCGPCSPAASSTEMVRSSWRSRK